MRAPATAATRKPTLTPTAADEARTKGNATGGSAHMSRQTIHIHTERAPQAIGTYSQAVRAGDTVYLSGQVPLDPATMQLVSGDVEAQIRRVFDNLKAVAEAAGGSLAQAVKMNVYQIGRASCREREENGGRAGVEGRK